MSGGWSPIPLCSSVQIGGYFACPASVGSAEGDRRAASERPWERPSPDIRGPAREAGRNVECLAPAGGGRYAQPMEISPNWGNFPRLGVQVPPRTRQNPAAACLRAYRKTGSAYAAAGPCGWRVLSFLGGRSPWLAGLPDDGLGRLALVGLQGSGGLVVDEGDLAFAEEPDGVLRAEGRPDVSAASGAPSPDGSEFGLAQQQVQRWQTSQRAILANVGIFRPAGIRDGGAGVTVTAPVSGFSIRPGRFHPAPARPAHQQPSQ
jgi:hypothetical protein